MGDDIASQQPVRRRDWNAVAAIIASLIGLLALAVSGYTAWLQHQQVRAEVWPRLEIVKSNINLKWWIANQGLGPAEISGMRVQVDGKLVRRWTDAMHAFGFTGKDGFAVTTVNGSVIRPGDTVDLLTAADNDDSRRMLQTMVDDGGHSLEISVCYCSVLDDCWLANSRAPVRSPAHNLSVEKCPIPESEQFED